ncbi:MAG: hypothetical protein Q9168_000387 [Polycauliona sp. 1 TL-2023]
MSAQTCHAKTGIGQSLEEKVIESASAMLELIKEHRAAQASTETIDRGTPSTGNASESHEDRMNAAVLEEPVTLRQRLIFRANVPIHIPHFLSVHRSYVEAEAKINEFSASHAKVSKMEEELFGEARLENPDEEGILFRCALREVFETEVLNQCLAYRVLPRPLRHMLLFEGMLIRHGIPNRCEIALLCNAEGQFVHYLAAWRELSQDSYQ